MQREHGAYTSNAIMIMNKYDYSNNNGDNDDEFTLSEKDAEELSVRLRVGKSIITFNAYQLRGISYTLLAFYESFQKNVLHKANVAFHQPPFNSKQMAILLEFYLQMDGLSSYMYIISVLYTY